MDEIASNGCMTNEKNLIDRTIHGDDDAFAQLMERYASGVYVLIVRITRNEEDAEELTQDVLLRVFENLPYFNFKSSFSTWLYRIAYNCAISFARRKRQPLYPIEENRLRLVGDDDLERMEAASENEQQIEALTRAINRLDAEERALITLFYYEQRPIAECAEIMSQSQSNIKVRLHRIRKKLYILIQNETE
mgnify:CR=1 FL=1